MSETLNLCACGCGEIAAPKARYIRGHQLRRTRPIAMVEDDDAPIVPSNVWRGIVADEFLFSYHDMVLKFQPGEIVVDTPLYQHLQANQLPILWEQ